jgi:cold shock protein
MSAAKVMSEAETTAVQPAPQPTTTQSVKETGTVKWFDDAKGYGFISRDNGGEALVVHFTAVSTDATKLFVKGSGSNSPSPEGGKALARRTWSRRSKPMPKSNQPLTEEQLRQFRNAVIASLWNRFRYAADICGYTSLTTETITTLEKLIESGSANIRPLYQQATKSTFANEPFASNAVLTVS